MPEEVARLLGVSREDLARTTKPGRAIVFLAAGSGALRVVGARRQAALVAEAMVRESVVAKATLTKSLIFNIPKDVYRPLGMRTHDLGRGIPRGTDDQFMWCLPEGEYYVMRKGRSLTEPHVYLRNACV